MMKLDVKDAHDRFKYFTNKNFSISECCQDLINQRPFGEHAFYIFAHSRTDEDGITKRLIWQPRLTKPKAQTNSMLFKAYPGKENIKIIWMIPARELWGQYKFGLITENKTISDSIYDFEYNREKLEKKEPDDLDDKTIDAIYKQLRYDALQSKEQDKYKSQTKSDKDVNKLMKDAFDGKSIHEINNI